VADIVEDGNGRIWIATRGSGISIIDKELKQVIVVKHDEKNKRSLCWNVLLSMYCDMSGGVWVGSYGAGIDYWHPSMYKFGSFQYNTEIQNGLTVESVTDLIGDSEGNVWVSGFGKHTLNVIDKKTKECRAITNAFSTGINIRSLCLDKNQPDKIIWLGTEGNDPQLMKYNYKTGIVERNYNFFNTTTRISCIYDDGSGGIWIGASKGLVFLNKNNDQYKVYQNVPDVENSLSHNLVTCIEADHKGNIWVGTLDGLNKLVLTDHSVSRFYHQALDSTTIGHDVIQSLKVDSKNVLWVGTYRGLNKYDPESNSFVRHNYLSEQFAEEVILAIEEDAIHNLWVSTTKGLTCFNQQSGEIKNYGALDGIIASNLIPNVSYKGKNGQMYLGGVKGITVFDPAKMPFNTYSPTVVVTDLEIFNEQVKVNEVKKGKYNLTEEMYCTDTLHLSFKESVISFRFSTLSYVLPAKNQYAYILEGFDDNWHNIGNRHFVTYTNLYPGTYVLKVRGSNNDGVWSEKETSIVLIISPPFYATWWFVSLVFLLLVFSIIGGYYLRLRFIKKQKKALEILVRERTRDLQESTMLLEEKSEEILVQKELLEEQNKEMMAQNEELELHRNSLTQLVEERTKELVGAKEKAEESDRLKSVFLANMSHEIRTPMNAIVGFSELLEEDSVTKEEQHQYLSMIYSNSLALLNLINDLLDFSKIEANQLQLYASAYDVNELVDEASATAQSLKNQLGKGTLVINTTKPSNVTQSVFVLDGNRLRQVLNNLLSNAIKFSFKGAIEISYWLDEKNLYFSVKDQGIGIDKSKHNVIFNRFTRVTSDVSKPILGNGLGLAIVKSLVELMGGEIAVESELDKGAKFSFYIPRVDA
jgi:signal transduction histidine kinase/sugar lactone lactonase YvrE